MLANKYKKIEYRFDLCESEVQHFEKTYNLLGQMIDTIEEDDPEEGTVVLDFAGYVQEVQYDTLIAVYSCLRDLI